MILQALCGFYDRAANAPDYDMPRYGFAMQGASVAIVLNREGDVKAVYSIEVPSGKKLAPALLCVPIAPKRAGQLPKPAFLCENIAFLFGVYDRPEGAKYRFKASAEMHNAVLSDVDDDGARAILRFFAKRKRGVIEYDGVDTTLLKDARKVAVFRLEGDTEYLHDRPAIREAWSAYMAIADADAPIIQCLVTGEDAPLARLHGNVAGFGQNKPTLVGFNQPAFEFFGKKQGENAPVGVQSAYAYVAALNLLCRDPKHHVSLAGDKLVFWAERDAPLEEGIMGAFFGGALPTAEPALDASEREKVQGILRNLTEGGNPEDYRLDLSLRFYVLGLAANKTRLIIRFFYQSAFGNLLSNAIAHYRDIRVVGMRNPYPAPRDLLFEIAVQHKAENVPATLESSLMRCILGRLPYPRALYDAVLRRIRHEAASGGQLVSALRAGVIKGFLIRETKEEISMGLDEQARDPAYLMGRLFALLERIQETAIENLNASIADKFLSSALASPQSVFPSIISLSHHHIQKLRKDEKKFGLMVHYKKKLDAVYQSLQLQTDQATSESYVFPLSMNANEQGKFLLGYYHQVQDLFTKKPNSEDETQGGENDAE